MSVGSFFRGLAREENGESTRDNVCFSGGCCVPPWLRAAAPSEIPMLWILSSLRVLGALS